MKKDLLQEALRQLVPENPDWFGWAKIDSDGNEIPNDQRMQTKYVIVNEQHKEIATRPTDKSINDKLAELEKDYSDKEYQRKRLEEYNEIGTGEQFDMIYHGIDAWKTKIKSIKDKYPKPE